MISKYYPDTGNSLANAITICARAWYEHDSVGYEESSNESPIATYFATISADNIYIGEVYKDKKFRCPELTEDLVKSVWVPIIFYETTSPIILDKDKLYIYLRIYQWAINNFTSHKEGKICAIFSKYHREYIDTIDPIHTMKVMNNNYLRSKFKRKGDKQVTLYEFQYMFQDEYCDILERLIESMSKLFRYDYQGWVLHNVGEDDIKNDYFPPIDPPEGYKWLNEADGTIYEYIKIGPLGMWKPMTDHKEGKSSFPSNPRQGGYFYNTEDGAYYKYIDDDWIPIPPMLEV